MTTDAADTDPADFYGVNAFPPADATRPTEPTSQHTPEKPTADRRGRFAVLNKFVDCSMRELKPVEQSVWFVLFRDAQNGVAETAQSYIAGRIGVSDRTVRR